MNATELREQIKECHPDHRSGDHRAVGKMHRLLAALRRRCPVCDNPMPFKRSPSKLRILKTCGNLCALRLRYGHPIALLGAFLVLACPLRADQVGIGWDASPSPGVTSYNIYLFRGTNAPQKVNFVGLATSFNLTNRTQIYVTALNSAGMESDPSNSIFWDNATTNTPPTKPLPPGALRFTTTTTTTTTTVIEQGK